MGEDIKKLGALEPTDDITDLNVLVDLLRNNNMRVKTNIQEPYKLTAYEILVKFVKERKIKLNNVYVTYPMLTGVLEEFPELYYQLKVAQDGERAEQVIRVLESRGSKNEDPDPLKDVE